mmetsp:Transcript_18676/g.38408  ORF Transcript_18676/g.38408 Transcript_18676/m.38408 type:complete len:255 (-) Transcript_18676:32-796(-)
MARVIHASAAAYLQRRAFPLGQLRSVGLCFINAKNFHPPLFLSTGSPPKTYLEPRLPSPSGCKGGGGAASSDVDECVAAAFCCARCCDNCRSAAMACTSARFLQGTPRASVSPPAAQKTFVTLSSPRRATMSGDKRPPRGASRITTTLPDLASRYATCTSSGGVIWIPSVSMPTRCGRPSRNCCQACGELITMAQPACVKRASIVLEFDSGIGVVSFFLLTRRCFFTELCDSCGECNLFVTLNSMLAIEAPVEL